MRLIPSLILLATCLGPAAGCQWAGLRDPVPASLTASRKLSSEGNELLEQKQPEQAEAKLAEAVRICPADCDARGYYAEALWLRNARPEAVAQLEEACRLPAQYKSENGTDQFGSEKGELRVRLAEMYLEMGRLDEAEGHVDQALSRNLRLAAAWRVRGRVLRATGDRLLADGSRDQAHADYLQALADLHKAAGFDANDRQVMGETAAVYRSLGQPQRALESMQGLLETYTPGEEPQQVLYWTGLDYIARQRYDDAVTTLTTALSRDRPTSDLLYSLGEAQYRSGRGPEATATLQRALAINPQHVPSRQLLAEIQVAQQGGAVWR